MAFKFVEAFRSHLGICGDAKQQQNKHRLAEQEKMLQSRARADERIEAVQLSMALRQLGQEALSVSDDLASQLPRLQAQAMDRLRERGWQPDYLTVRNRLDLQAPLAGDALVVLGAAKLGKTRLIDNLELIRP